jgi:hypothetical protein
MEIIFISTKQHFTRKQWVFIISVHSDIHLCIIWKRLINYIKQQISWYFERIPLFIVQ